MYGCAYIYILYITYIIYIIYKSHMSAGFSLRGIGGNPSIAKNLLIHPAPGKISSPTKG